MTRKSGTLYVLCAKCGSFWLPQEKDESTIPRCSKCRSRQTTKATAEEIQDHLRERFRKETLAEVLRESGGTEADVALTPGSVADYIRGKAWKERAEKLSLGPEAAAEKKRAQGRAGKRPHGRDALAGPQREKSKDTEQPIHKRIGIKADKLERIVADFEKAEKRSELDEHGRPLISEEHNVKWIHLVGKVTWRTAHKIFHEVLMKDAECTLPIGYKPME